MLSRSSRKDREAIARLWLSEGLPFAFQECPAIFEEVREWLGKRLCVHPKEVTLIGSARIGYSLSGSKFGKCFDKNSDLDFSVISGGLYRKLGNDFNRFVQDFEEGAIHPKNDRERKYWPENIHVGRKSLLRGFLDSKKIPNLSEYSTAKNINGSMWLLLEKIKNVDTVPNVSRASVRVYQNWNSFIDQTTLNLKRLMEEI